MANLWRLQEKENGINEHGILERTVHWAGLSGGEWRYVIEEAVTVIQAWGTDAHVGNWRPQGERGRGVY